MTGNTDLSVALSLVSANKRADAAHILNGRGEKCAHGVPLPVFCTVYCSGERLREQRMLRAGSVTAFDNGQTTRRRGAAKY